MRERERAGNGLQENKDPTNKSEDRTEKNTGKYVSYHNRKLEI